MLIVIMLLVICALWFIRYLWPVNGLAFIDMEAMARSGEAYGAMKILDIRDAVDYQSCHMPSAINISIGRLPFVWNKEISPIEPVLIMSDSLYKSKKAARLLKKRGFNRLYALRGLPCS
ncbi:rhodanese-like domain-containing protein [Paenibacillus sp. BAC0078]